jgi:hypothetical protein
LIHDNSDKDDDDKNDNDKNDDEFDEKKYKGRMVRELGAGVIPKDDKKEEERNKGAKVEWICQVCDLRFPTYQSYSEHYDATHR